MNTVQNGKGDSPRNNWGPDWYARYDAIDWRRQPPKKEFPAQKEAGDQQKRPEWPEWRLDKA